VTRDNIFSTFVQCSNCEAPIEERNKQLQILANGLASENLGLKARVSNVKAENAEVEKSRIKGENKVANLIEKLGFVFGASLFVPLFFQLYKPT
jgi:hypothetical protein